MKDSLGSLLLIENPVAQKLLPEIHILATSFIPMLFISAIIWELFNEMNITGVLKKLLLSMLVISFYPKFHQDAVKLSLSAAEGFVSRASPRNFFLMSWKESTIVKKEIKKEGVLEKIIIPNLNDLVATLMFIFAKVSFWILKLIYTAVYYLTLIFSPLAAVLPFLPFFHGALVGVFRSTLWCCLFPMVVSALLVVVGNTMDERMMRNELLVSDMDTLMWMCGVSALLLMSPMLTQIVLGSEGMASLGSRIGGTIQGTASGVVGAGKNLVKGIL